ncbi:MAG: TonB-dependent receptor [Methylacidiphilales bacterium]|nr:TonB-dependent receptor [Candidatus Methylacidiphilales bacterium]
MKNTPVLLVLSIAVFFPGWVAGQETAGNPEELPMITVVAEKKPGPLQDVPAGVTAVTGKTLDADGVTTVKDASIFAPNVFVNEFGAQKLSNPYFRGIGSSPNNPGITTFIDGVPQLNANSSSIHFLDIDQVEFVRGSQGELYGRDTVGGLINITSRPPGLTSWHMDTEGNYGNYDFREAQLSASGPIVSNELGLGLGGGYTARDGYTKNDFTGHDLDSRNDFFGKGQLLWRPESDWEIRLLFAGERDHDGDYALGDLGMIRADPHHVSHDFEGYTHRYVMSPTLWVGYKGETVDFTMITGLVHWQTEDLTDLDYTSDPSLYSTRRNTEKELQFSEEFRFASSKDTPLELADDLKLKWQAGVFTFTQDYKQDAFNDLSSSFAGLGPGFRLTQRQNADLQDVGTGVYGQSTLTAWDKLDFTFGLRCDWEQKDANFQTTTTVPLPPPFGGVFPSSVAASKDYTDVSPHFGLGYHVTKDHLVYATVTQGYKAGGFNASAPAGSESYGEEHTWDYELGCKTEWLNKRLLANLSLFYIDWRNIQTNQPNPASPGQFYIANAGAAASKGVELELTARPVAGLDIFGGFGYTDARFLSGSTDSGVNIGGNRLQYAPEFTANAGTQYSLALCKEMTAYARAEVIACGSYEYNNQNNAGQEAYTLANFRLGVRGVRWFAEGWIKNAFDTNYVPVAFTYNSPAGLIGESGAPMTCGVRAGVNF